MSEMGFAPHDDQHRGGPGLLSFMLNVMGLGGNPRAVNPDNVTNRGSSYETDQRAGRAGSGGQAASGSCMHVSETSKVTLRAVLALVVFYCIVLVIFLPFKHNWAGDDESTGWAQLVSAMYFASVTLSTVGYGDVLPTSAGQQLVTCGLIFFGLTFIMYEFSQLTTIWIEKMEEENEKMMKMMKSVDLDGDGITDTPTLSPRVMTGITSVAWIVALLAIGTLVLAVWEEYEFVDALYGAVATITTVGYGDVSFSRTGTRVFATFYILIAPLFTVKLLGDIVNAVLDTQGKLERSRMKMLNKAMSKDELGEMDFDGDGAMSEVEFVVSRLHAMRLMDRAAFGHVKRLQEHFREIDVDKSGLVDAADLRRSTTGCKAPAPN
mmetsp:Transcript_18767/g.35764  ORF Transcript_18767/g.35764 Transcript_18767/m.35764 type:complete len:379 (+) Transcript_18767:157-1293(+)